MIFNELQPEKAKSPILVTLSGRLMLVNELQQEKALSPILVTSGGIAKLFCFFPAGKQSKLVLLLL